MYLKIFNTTCKSKSGNFIWGFLTISLIQVSDGVGMFLDDPLCGLVLEAFFKQNATPGPAFFFDMFEKINN